MARTNPLLDSLSAVDLFSGLSRGDLRRVSEAGKEVTFGAGEDLTVQGREGGRFFLILEGEVEISVGGRVTGREGPGAYVGEISLIDGQPRSASVVAVTPVRAWTLASWNFRPLLRSYPTVAEKILLLLCQRLRAAEATID